MRLKLEPRDAGSADCGKGGTTQTPDNVSRSAGRCSLALLRFFRRDGGEWFDGTLCMPTSGPMRDLSQGFISRGALCRSSHNSQRAFWSVRNGTFLFLFFFSRPSFFFLRNYSQSLVFLLERIAVNTRALSHLASLMSVRASQRARVEGT